MTAKDSTHGFDHLVDHLDTRYNFVLRISGYKTMQIFFGIFSVLFGPRFAFLNTALASDTNLCTTFPLHLLQAVAAPAGLRADDE